jgi:hypothetical protein
MVEERLLCKCEALSSNPKAAKKKKKRKGREGLGQLVISDALVLFLRGKCYPGKMICIQK